jgi:tRNA threonylcarbamoyladenosine modification (KEOPS) complex  Pcc1 subunit
MPVATLHINSSSPQRLLRALGPELGREVPKSKVNGAVDNDRMLLSIEATDLSSLRAALNSYLRWIKIIKDIEKLAGV